MDKLTALRNLSSTARYALHKGAEPDEVRAVIEAAILDHEVKELLRLLLPVNVVVVIDVDGI